MDGGSDGRGSRDTLWTRTRGSLLERAAGQQGPAARLEAWRTLIGLYERPIKAAMARRVPAADAEDAAHEFFLWLQDGRLLGRFDPASHGGRPFRAFLQGVIAKWSANRRRYEARRRGVSLDASPLPLPDPGDEFAAHDAQDWAHHGLGLALGRLREVDQQLLREAYGLAGGAALPEAELAARRNTTVKTLRVQVSRARARLVAAFRQAVGETTEPGDMRREADLLVAALSQAERALFEPEGEDR